MNLAWSVAWATWRAMAETSVFWWAGICVSLVGKRPSGGCASPSFLSAVTCSEWKHGQTHTPKPYFLEYEWSSNTSLKRDLSQASTRALKPWILIFACSMATWCSVYKYFQALHDKANATSPPGKCTIYFLLHTQIFVLFCLWELPSERSEAASPACWARSSACTQLLQPQMGTEIMWVVKLGPSLAPTVANNPVKIHFVQAVIFLDGKKVIFILGSL